MARRAHELLGGVDSEAILGRLTIEASVATIALYGVYVTAEKVGGK